jgi:signal transduction histidine kinase/DNA-binding NarL/FixJ family response regulator/Tol biopolymer transport system component
MALTTAVLCVLAVIWIQFPNGIRLNPEARITPVDIPLGDFQYPALSTDGTWIAFAAIGVDESADIYRYDMLRGTTQRLTKDRSDGLATLTSISPDGAWVVYGRKPKGVLRADLCIVPSEGGSSRVLARGGVFGHWHPSGDSIGFVRLHRRDPKGKVSLWSVRPDGSGERRLFLDSVSSAYFQGFCWAPDGRRAAWIRAHGDTLAEILIINFATGDVRAISSGQSNIDDLWWTSNGAIIYSSARSGTFNLWMVDENGGASVRLTQGEGPDMAARMTPGGDRILIYRRRQWGELWSGSLDGTGSRPVSLVQRNVQSAAVNPVTGRTVFSAGYEPTAALDVGIYSLDEQGFDVKLGDEPFGKSDWMDFSPDGSRLAYSVRRTQAEPIELSEIRMIDTASIYRPRTVGRGLPLSWLDSVHLAIYREARTRVIDVTTGVETAFPSDSTRTIPLNVPGLELVQDLRRGRTGFWTRSPGDRYRSATRLFDPSEGLSPVVSSSRSTIALIGETGEVWKVDPRSGKRVRIPGRIQELKPYSYARITYDDRHLLYVVPHTETRLMFLEGPFLPPWWRSTMAYASLGAGLLIILLFVRRYERRRDRDQHQRELERLETKNLREMDAIKSQFFANISHEFRTPLTLIEGPMSELVGGRFSGDRREMYEMVLRNARRLLRLVNQLLDLSRLDAGQRRLHPKKGDIAEAIRTIAASFESLAARRSIIFEVNALVGPIRGSFDQEVLEQVLTNLLSNAFKFTPDGGMVLLDIRQSTIDNRHSLELSISDTGVGIPPEALDKVFDRFYQVDASQTREQEGTGIGLALTKELIDLHGGTIAVTSQPGKGTTFTVQLRIDLPESEGQPGSVVLEQRKHEAHEDLTSGLSAEDQLPTTDDQRPSTDDWRPPTEDPLPIVLVIDDNRDMRRYIRRQLEDHYRVIEASNGKDGLELAKSKTPDLVVSDVMMPKMDGFEVCRRLKSDVTTSHIPVVLLTAKAGDGHKLEGLETGADDYVVKPFDAKELKARLKNLHSQRIRMREAYRRELVVQPTGVKVESMDEQFLKKVFETIETRMSDPKLGPDVLARAAAVSRMTLHRKLKAITGMSTGEIIRDLRLQRAHSLIQQKAGTVSEIAYEVGFQNLSHFAKAFHAKYGSNPSELKDSAARLRITPN